MPKDVTFPDRYFVMAIGQYLDSFSPKQSEPASWRPDLREYCFFNEGKKPMSGLALSREVFGDAHLWRERRMSSPLICFSDRLMSEIAANGLRLPKHCRLNEI
jgi:hypothetical protein